MNGKGCRIAAAALALALVLGFLLLPGVEETILPLHSGHQKWKMEDGDSASWPWTPELDGCSALGVQLKSTKKAQGMTLTAAVTDPAGREAASAVQPIAELEGEEILLSGTFLRGTEYTLTLRTAGEGSLTVQGEEDEEGNFLPELKETGVSETRSTVLLYFAAGLILLALTPVTGEGRALRRAAGGRRRAADWLLPWGTFLLICGTGLLVDLLKPPFRVDQPWMTWDEDVHLAQVEGMSLLSGGGLRGCLSRVITWQPGYVPLAVGYNLGELAGLVFRTPEGFAYRCAVIAGTLCYAGMCALAVRHAPRFRASFLVAGSLPAMIFQATCMTYDTVVAGSVLLGTALLLETLERRERLSAGRAVLLTALLAMGTVAKPAYSVTVLLLLMIPADRFGSRREAWAFRGFVVLMTAWCAAAMAMPGAYGNVLAGDARFGDTDARAQIRGMLADPAGSGLKPVRYLWEKAWLMGVSGISFWAYLRYGLEGLNELYLLAALLIAPLCTWGEDRETESPLTAGRRIGFALAALGAEILLAYAQYIASSPVGGSVEGMQSRYILPVWAPAMLAVMWPQGMRRRARAAGGVMTAALFALLLWANAENALIHLGAAGLI